MDTDRVSLLPTTSRVEFSFLGVFYGGGGDGRVVMFGESDPGVGCLSDGMRSFGPNTPIASFLGTLVHLTAYMGTFENMGPNAAFKEVEALQHQAVSAQHHDEPSRGVAKAEPQTKSRK